MGNRSSSLLVVHKSELDAPWGLLERNQDWAVLNLVTTTGGVIAWSGTEKECRAKAIELNVPERQMPRRGFAFDMDVHCEALRTTGALRCHTRRKGVDLFVSVATLDTPQDYVRACDQAQAILTNLPAIERTLTAPTITVSPLPISDAEVTAAHIPWAVDGAIQCTGSLYWVAAAYVRDIQTQSFPTDEEAKRYRPLRRCSFPSFEEAEAYLLECALGYFPGPDGAKYVERAAKLTDRHRIDERGTLYYFNDYNHTAARTRDLGHGGRPFWCIHPDGSEIVSNDVYYCDTIPAPYRHLYGTPCRIEQINQNPVRQVAA